jgi:hypothetical protein
MADTRRRPLFQEAPSATERWARNKMVRAGVLFSNVKFFYAGIVTA